MVVVSKQSFMFRRRSQDASPIEQLAYRSDAQWLVTAQPEPQYAPDWIKETNLYKSARDKELLYEANVPKDVAPGKLNDTYTANPVPAYHQPKDIFEMSPQGTGLPGGKRQKGAREGVSGGV